MLYLETFKSEAEAKAFVRIKKLKNAMITKIDRLFYATWRAK